MTFWVQLRSVWVSYFKVAVFYTSLHIYHILICTYNLYVRLEKLDLLDAETCPMWNPVLVHSYWNEGFLCVSGFSMASPSGRASKTGNGNFRQKKRKGRGERETMEKEGIATKGRGKDKGIKPPVSLDVGVGPYLLGWALVLFGVWHRTLPGCSGNICENWAKSCFIYDCHRFASMEENLSCCLEDKVSVTKFILYWGGGRRQILRLFLFLSLALRRDIVKLPVYWESILVYGNVANDSLKCTCWHNILYQGQYTIHGMPKGPYRLHFLTYYLLDFFFSNTNLPFFFGANACF